MIFDPIGKVWNQVFVRISQEPQMSRSGSGGGLGIMLKRGLEPSKRRGSFNNRMMATVFVPLISFWLIFACYIIWSGVNDETGAVQGNLDFYVSLIAIIGGPALLGISAVLRAWELEATAELEILPDSLTAINESTKALQKHNLAMEDRNIQHQLDLEKMTLAHELEMKAMRTKAELGLEGKAMPKLSGKKGE